jgi:hypothetical protein
MLSFLYYVTIFYCSVFFLSILDKINKGEIKTKDDVKVYLLSKCFVIISKYHKIKRISNEAYQKLTYRNDSDSDDEDIKYKFNLHILSQNKKINLKMLKEDDKIKIQEVSLIENIDEKDVKVYIEYNSFLKEIKELNLKELTDQDSQVFTVLNEEIEEFMDDEILKDKKLFLNVELINGKLRNSETIDLTNIIQKYFVENNVILSQQFLEYILKFDFNTKLDENYTLNIMTRDVEMINLVNTQKINIVKDDENNLIYKILTNDN